MNGKCRVLLDCLPKPPDYEYDWKSLGEIPELAAWFSRMEGTPQQPEWHGECDVMAHTRMVCRALAGMEAFRAMPAHSRDARRWRRCCTTSAR